MDLYILDLNASNISDKYPTGRFYKIIYKYPLLNEDQSACKNHHIYVKNVNIKYYIQNFIIILFLLLKEHRKLTKKTYMANTFND